MICLYVLCLGTLEIVELLHSSFPNIEYGTLLDSNNRNALRLVIDNNRPIELLQVCFIIYIIFSCYKYH